MKTFVGRNHRHIGMLTLAAFCLSAVAVPAFGEPVIKLNKNFEGAIDTSGNGLAAFTLEGNATQLGNFKAVGEVNLPADVKAGGQGTAEGIVVFEAANGDQLVGVTTWEIGAGGLGELHFAWRDSVTFSDGTVVSSTGRFEHDRPRGLVVIAIIAILIGLLLPAVQKVR